MENEYLNPESYKIKRNEKGFPMFNAKLSWTDENENFHSFEVDDAERLSDIVGLLTGEIGLSDLLP